MVLPACCTSIPCKITALLPTFPQPHLAREWYLYQIALRGDKASTSTRARLVHRHVPAIPVLPAVVDQDLLAGPQSSRAPAISPPGRADEDADPPLPLPALQAPVGRHLHQAVAELGVGPAGDAVEVVGHARLVAAARGVDAEAAAAAVAPELGRVERAEAQVVVAARVRVVARVRVHPADVQAEEGRGGQGGGGEQAALAEGRVVRRAGDGADADAGAVVGGRDQGAGDPVQGLGRGRGPAEGVAHVGRHGRGVGQVGEVLHLFRPVLGGSAGWRRGVGGGHFFGVDAQRMVQRRQVESDLNFCLGL